RSVVRAALADKDDDVRHAALNSVSMWRDKQAAATLTKLIGSESGHDRRLAAEGLGRLRDPAAIPTLLDALLGSNDRFVEHAVIYALIEIADTSATQSGLESPHANVRRGAMIALDQMAGDKLEPRRVVAELDSRDARMQDAAWWIVS